MGHYHRLGHFVMGSFVMARFVASSPAYPGLARGASGGAITGGQPPDDRDPSRPPRPSSGAVDLVDGDLSNPVTLPYPSDLHSND